MAFSVDLNQVQAQNTFVRTLLLDKLIMDAAVSRLGSLDALTALTAPQGPGQTGGAGNQAQQVMLAEMVMMLAGLMNNRNGANGQGANGQGADAGVSQISSTGGSGGSSAAGGSGSADMMSSSSGSGGQGADASVKLAESKLGQAAIDVKMDNYTHAGGVTNNCADFVSGILANTQGFKKKPGDASVAQFEKDLKEQGWREVSKDQAKAGDVVIINGSQHTELVTKDGGKEAIGSNGSSSQTIKKDNLGWGSEKFYHKG